MARARLEGARAYSIKPDIEGGVTCNERNSLPDHAQVRHLEIAEGGRLVQWAVVVVEETIHLVFKGTSEAFDAIVDVGVLMHDDAEHGLRVHGGMWMALNQREHRVIDLALEALRRELANGRKQVVLCGHSLGGGYAILSALQFLHKKLEVQQVIAFGAPQVVVPEDTPLWRALNEVTTVFVNSYDIVPRLPSCVDWLGEALPHCLSKSVGPVTLSVDPRAKLEKVVQQHGDLMRAYRPIGTLAFISESSRFVRRARSSCERGDDELKMLRSAPQPFGAFVVEQHSSVAYASILRHLAAAA